MERTTIVLPPNTRDRLRRDETKGMSCGQVLEGMMAALEREGFPADVRRPADEDDLNPPESA